MRKAQAIISGGEVRLAVEIIRTAACQPLAKLGAALPCREHLPTRVRPAEVVSQVAQGQPGVGQGGAEAEVQRVLGDLRLVGGDRGLEGPTRFVAVPKIRLDSADPELGRGQFSAERGVVATLLEEGLIESKGRFQ